MNTIDGQGNLIGLSIGIHQGATVVDHINLEAIEHQAGAPGWELRL
jgi:hypothetical protein